MRTVALDVHAATLSLGVFTPEGQFLQFVKRTTTGKELVNVVSAVVGSKTVTVEECHLAQWVKRVLTPYAERIFICDPAHNRSIARATHDDDRQSVLKLAHLYRSGHLRELHHPKT